MKDRENINIDQSIKVNSWGTESPSFPNQQQQFFQKIARNGREQQRRNEKILETPGFQGEMNQVADLEQGFRRLKNEQIQKLRHLKTEYEEIRKITTDYISPKMDQHYSPSSSRQSQSQHIISPKGGKSRVNGFGGGVRDYQILQLQKKQLQIMVQNSMKKIEELLHNQMEYKKTIHELKLQKESRLLVQGQSTGFGISRVSKRREKESGDQIRVLQLQRQSLLSSVTGLRERVKYLQAGLSSSQQQLRKMFEQKKNYEELIRMQRDKFMNLQITYRREKREYQIMEKDKNAEINHLMKLKDMKESGLEGQLRGTIANLQEEVKTKEKRYGLLLEQFENYQKERIKEQKEQEIKLVNQILNKSNEQPNKFMQQTLNSILQRITELETRNVLPDFVKVQEKKVQQQKMRQPIKHVSVHTQIIDRVDKVQQLQLTIADYRAKMGELDIKIQEYNKKNEEFVRKINALESSNRQLTQQITSLRLEKEVVEQKNAILVESQRQLQEQFERYKQEQKLKKSQIKDRSVTQLNVLIKEHSSVEPVVIQKTELAINSVLTPSRISKLQTQVQRLNAELQRVEIQKRKIEDENRALLLRVNKIQFELQKAIKEGQFQLDINKKSADVVINGLSQDLNQMRDLFNRANNEVIRLRKILQGNRDTVKQETANLLRTIQNIQKEKNNSETQLKTLYNNNVAKLKEEHSLQIQELTTSIQNLTNLNRKLQQSAQYNRGLQGENQELKYLIQTIQTQNNSDAIVYRGSQADYHPEQMGTNQRYV